MDWEWEDERHTDCVVFHKVNEEFGGMSNMSNEYPLEIAGIDIGSTEALYQACRFPHRPDWQREILDAPHAFAAKLKAKKERRRAESRPDWNAVRVDVMRWCLEEKLDQHFGDFYKLLHSTGRRAIVERSRCDRFWGAVPENERLLRGANQLGRQLMTLRDFVVDWMQGDDEDEEWPEPAVPRIPDFRLLGIDIAAVRESPR